MLPRPVPRRRRRATATVAALAVLPALFLPGTSRAATSPAPSGPSTAQLEADVQRRAAALLDAQDAGEQSAGAASAALERYVAAQRAADRAALALQRAEQAQAAAAAEVARGQERLSTWVAALYRSGGGSPALVAVNDLLATLADGSDPHAVAASLSQLQVVAEGQQDQLAALQRSHAAAAAALRAAAAARQQAATAAEAAREQKTLAAAVVAESTRRLAAAERGATEAQAALAARQAAGQRAADAGAAAPALRAGASLSLSGCSLASAGAYENGRLPASALCPLASAPGHLLRADAAAAFDRLSAAYAAALGTRLCITDSYRDHAAQVAVRAAKPTLAAVPGTSNHGWGLAVDLCGGVEDFGSPQRVWLEQRALAFGWFSPAWAASDGSKPEPWHWEFAG